MVTGTYEPGLFRADRAPDEEMPERTSLGTAKDLAIDTARGVSKFFTAVPAAKLMLHPDDPEAQKEMEQQRLQDERFKSWKTDKGQFLEEHPERDTRGFTRRMLEGVATGAPLVAASIATGGVGAALLGGAQGFANQSADAYAEIYGKSDKQLYDSNPKYAQLIDNGMSDADARKQLYRDSHTLAGDTTAIVTNAIGNFGVGRLAGKAFMRNAGKEMTDSILKNTARHGLEGGAGMSIMGAGTEYGAQKAQVGAGFQADVDPDKVWAAGLEGGEQGVILGGAAGALSSFRGGRRTPVKPSAKVAEPVGSDVSTTLANQLESNQPKLPVGDEGHPAQQPPEIPAETPPGFGRKPGPAAPQPAEPVGTEGMPPETAAAPPPRPVPPAAAAPAGPGVATGLGAKLREGTAKVVDPAAAPTATPAQGTDTEPPAAPAFTREDLFARANDVGLTPTQGDLQKHIAEWQRANPGEKIGKDYSELTKQWSAANKVAKKQAADEAKAAKAQEKAAKAQAAEQAKQEAAAKAAAAAKPAEAPKPPEEVTPPSKPVEAPPEIKEVAPAPPVEEPAQALKAEEPAPAEAAPAKAEPKQAKSGPEAAEAMAKKSRDEQAAKQKAIDEKAAADKAAGVKKPKTQEELDKQADRKGVRREDDYNAREQIARETREANAPPADFKDHIAAIKKSLAEVRGEQIPKLLKPVIDHAKEMLSKYRARMDEVGFKTSDPGAPARARNVGPYGRYMAHLHTFVRGIEEDIRNHKYDNQKGRAERHLDVESRMLEKGGPEALHAEASERNKAQNVIRKEKSTQGAKEKSASEGEALEHEASEAHEVPGTTAEEIEDEVQRRLDKGKPERQAEDREPGLEQEYVGGKDGRQDFLLRSEMMKALKREERKVGHPLNLFEAQELLRKYDPTISDIGHTFGDELPKVEATLKSPILKEIYKHVFRLTKDIPLTVWSRDAHETFEQYRNWSPSRAYYTADWAHGSIYHETAVPRTIFHEALHAATSRALYISPKFRALINDLRGLLASRYKNDPRIFGSEGFEKGILKNEHEFVSELYTRPEFADFLKETELDPTEMKMLWMKGYDPGRAKTFFGAVWDGFLKAIGFKPKTPNAYAVATDVLAEMFDAEKALQVRDAQRGEMPGVLNRAEINNLAQRWPLKNRNIKEALEAEKHGYVTNQMMDNAQRLAEDPVAGELSEKYLRKLNNATGNEWVNEEKVTPVRNSETVVNGFRNFLREHAGDTGKDVAFRSESPLERLRANVGYGLTWTHKLGEVGEQGFREVMGKALDLLQKHEGYSTDYMTHGGPWSTEAGQHLVTDLAALKHSIKDPELWDRFEKFLIRESGHTAYADEALGVGRNKHIDANALVDEQTRSEHKDLQDEWNALKAANPEFEAMRDRLHKFGAAEQEARSRKYIARFAAHLGMIDPNDKVASEAIVKRVRGEQDQLTFAEKRALDKMAEDKDFDENLKDIKKSRELVKLAGPYIPFMRRGRWSLFTKFKVTPDAKFDFKGVKEDPKEGVDEGFDFADLQDAKNFIHDKLNPQGIAQTGGHEIILDKRTGKVAKQYTDEEFDQANAKAKEEWDKAVESGKASGPYKPIENRTVTPKIFKESPEDYPNAQLHYRVTFNPKSFELFDSEREAHEARDNYLKDTSGNTLVGEVEDAPEYDSRANREHTSYDMQRLINRVEAGKAYQDLTPSQQGKIKREMAVESMRIQTTSARRARFLPRTYAKGASTDILQNMIEFATSQAHSMADLEYGGQTAKALKDIEDYNDSMRFQKGSAERKRAFQELQARVEAAPPKHNAVNNLIGKALRYSQVGHLADLGYLITNATDNWINALPVVGARHGYMHSARMLGDASSMFSPKEFAKAALGDVKQAWLRQEQTVKYEKLANEMLAGQEDATRLGQNLRNIFQKGLISPDAGMEVQRLRNLDAGLGGRTFERVDGSFRAAAAGVETHNRLSLATAAYRLEYEKTGNHDLAMKYAEDMVRKGAGDYSTLNRPRLISSNPLLRLGMQFKQFPMRIVSNYADAIMGSFDRNATPEYRTQMRKQLAFMLATQSVAAGALGLPLGPASGAVNAGYMLGLWDSNWDDVTATLRREVAKYTGNEVAEVVFNGLPRILGIDMSRLSQNSFFFHGSPDTQDPKTNMGTLAMMALGAPGDSATKLWKGVQGAKEAVHLYNSGAVQQAYDKGVEALDNLTQVKAASDLIRAGRQLSGGPATQTRGGVPLGNEYTTYQAILRAIGLTSAKEAETTEKRHMETRDVKLAQQNETKAKQMFANADDKELAAIWRSVQENYNPTVDQKHQLTYADLVKARAQARKAAASDASKVGVRLSKKNLGIAEKYSYYNTAS